MMRAIAAALLVVFVGCSSGEDSGSGAPAAKAPPISKQVHERGKAACNAFAERACKCAKTDESLASVCEDASNRPKALDYAVRAARGNEIDERTRGRLVLEVQRIIEKCFEDDNKLPPTCPR